MRRRHRLSGRGSFTAVTRSGRNGVEDGIRVSAAPNIFPHARIGLAVRGTTSSVERNRARRRLRAAVHPHLERLAGHDLVIAAPARVAVMPWGVLERAVASGIARSTR